MNSKYIAFSGKISSGKSSISKRFSELTQIPYVSFGDYVRNEATKKGLPNNRESLQAIGETLVSGNQLQFCEEVLSTSQSDIEAGRIIDGIRHISILKTLRKILHPNRLTLIYVKTSDSTRHLRTKSTTESITSIWDKIEKHSTEQDVKAKLEHAADVVIDGEIDVDTNVKILTTRLS